LTKHSLINLLFGAALIGLIITHIQYQVPCIWYFLFVLLYFGIIALGSYFIQLNFFTFSYCQGRKDKKQITITFDDGPQSDFTPHVLDILAAEKVPATFFLIGKNIAGNEAIIKRIDKDGHLIGNHSWGHTFWFSMNRPAQSIEEIYHTRDTVESITGKRMRLFRPPYGVTNPLVAKAITATGVLSIGWSLRSYDTVAKSTDQLLARLIKTLKNGDIVLFHDWGRHTIGILPDYIKYVRTQGYEIVPLDRLLGIDAYEK
jgi:peptidoglycan/xylan/chitin deacetylase (PgdA/CDA1 family)